MFSTLCRHSLSSKAKRNHSFLKGKTDLVLLSFLYLSHKEDILHAPVCHDFILMFSSLLKEVEGVSL